MNESRLGKKDIAIAISLILLKRHSRSGGRRLVGAFNPAAMALGSRIDCNMSRNPP